MFVEHLGCYALSPPDLGRWSGRNCFLNNHHFTFCFRHYIDFHINVSYLHQWTNQRRYMPGIHFTKKNFTRLTDFGKGFS